LLFHNISWACSKRILSCCTSTSSSCFFSFNRCSYSRFLFCNPVWLIVL
jgi:hypothetical protein